MSKKKNIRSNTKEAKGILDKIKELRGNGSRIEKRHSDILFITGCTSGKAGDDGDEGMPAFKRYTGDASTRMFEFFGGFCYKKKRVLDLYVLSAGYGFIPASASIRKYDVSFNSVDAKLRKDMAKQLEIGADFGNILKLGYKLIILRLGGKYIDTLNGALKENDELRYETHDEATICYLASNSKVKILLSGGMQEAIVVPESMRKKYSGNNRYQDRIWSTFFNKHKDCSSDEIIKKLSRVKNFNDFEELLQ